VKGLQIEDETGAPYADPCQLYTYDVTAAVMTTSHGEQPSFLGAHDQMNCLSTLNIENGREYLKIQEFLKMQESEKSA